MVLLGRALGVADLEQLGGQAAEPIVSAPGGGPDVEREIVRTTVTQLRMIVVGAASWRSSG
ncbi:hypothetical protein BH10ACT10_BH10ACT10_16820 [soil metagenome]